MMNNTPAFLSSFSLSASVDKTMMEISSAYRPVVSASPPDIVIGKKRGPIPIEKPASTMQLPMASPMATSYCFLRMAVKSTANSVRVNFCRIKKP